MNTLVVSPAIYRPKLVSFEHFKIQPEKVTGDTYHGASGLWASLPDHYGIWGLDLRLLTNRMRVRMGIKYSEPIIVEHNRCLDQVGHCPV